MSTMGESKYLLHAHPGRNLPQQPQDLTPCPYSAVSSFNLPSYCDSTLITPISTQSPVMAIKTESTPRTNKDIKLSPSTISPSYHFLASDDDYSNGRYCHNPPMKHKSPSGTFHTSTLDSSFPASPYVCPEPFFGAYGVSATPVSGRSESSPSLNQSPAHLHSAGGLSSSSSSHARLPAQNASTFRSQNQAPILIAPSPSALRPATKQEGGPYRHNSLQSISTAPSSATVAQGAFSEPLGSLLPARGKKRKSPCRDSREKDMVFADDKTMDEELLLDLSHRQQLPWKEVQKRFNEATGKQMQVPALQMRKKRLIERIRQWTDDDEQALTQAVAEFDKNRWETIAESMLKYGCVAKWSKEMCQRKWQEMHPEGSPYLPPYEMSLRHRDSGDWGPDDGGFSDGRASACQSLHEGDSGVQMPAVSTGTMEGVRSRAASDASSQMLQMRHQHHQPQQMVFDQQHHNGWGPES